MKTMIAFIVVHYQWQPERTTEGELVEDNTLAMVIISVKELQSSFAANGHHMVANSFKSNVAGDNGRMVCR